MANRKATPNKEWVDALNTIDVVFQDDKKVRKAWREYYDSLDERLNIIKKQILLS